MDKFELLLSKSIYLNGIGELHIPTINDILKMGGINMYNVLLLPYILSTESLDNNDKKQYKNLDLVFMKKNGILEYSVEGISYLDLLLESLKFYFKKDVVPNTKQKTISIGTTGIIDRNNFDGLSDLMLKINFKQRPKVEKIPEFKNERQRDVYNKIMAGRRRKESKDSLTLADMTNIIVHSGVSYISYKEVCDMTIYQFYNSYYMITNTNNFRLNYPSPCLWVSIEGNEIPKWTDIYKE